MKKQDLRAEMPKTAALIDEFRAVFGTEYINKILQRGMRGEPVFWASENGHTIGTPSPPRAPAPPPEPERIRTLKL